MSNNEVVIIVNNGHILTINELHNRTGTTTNPPDGMIKIGCLQTIHPLCPPDEDCIHFSRQSLCTMYRQQQSVCAIENCST